MTWIEIRPMDVWLFRDGRPFNAGEDNAARSMFPPTSLTVQGALRQRISESNGVSYRQYRKGGTVADDLIGSYKANKCGLHTGAFRMRGPFVGVCTDDGMMPLFPAPADLLYTKNHDEVLCKDSASQPDKAANPRFIVSRPGQRLISDLQDNTERDEHSGSADYQLPEVYEGYENLPDCWMTGAAFHSYLTKHTVDVSDYLPASELSVEEEKIKTARAAIQKDKHIFHSSLVYGSENRFGVSTNSLTSFREEGQLYQAQFIRPTQDVGLIVDVTGKHNDDNLINRRMTMGGEQRLSSLKKVNSLLNFPEKSASINGMFKVIFLTPAYFKDGWLPEKSWSEIFGANVELVSAALYRPQRIGGWNSAAGKGAPRAMYNYVAPGSVYYFNARESFKPPAAITETPEEFTTPNSDYKHAYIGFGQVAYSQLNEQS